MIFSLRKEQWTNRDYICILNILCVFVFFFYITEVILDSYWDETGLDQCLKIDTRVLFNL